MRNPFQFEKFTTYGVLQCLMLSFASRFQILAVLRPEEICTFESLHFSLKFLHTAFEPIDILRIFTVELSAFIFIPALTIEQSKNNQKNALTVDIPCQLQQCLLCKFPKSVIYVNCTI